MDRTPRLFPLVTVCRSATFPIVLLLLGSVVRLLAAETADAPAPATDRVGLPAGYAANFTVLRTKLDVAGGKQVTVYGNPQTASVTTTAALPYPNGSVIVMETASLKKGPDGKPLQAVDGNYVRDAVLGLHVMKRGEGFGTAYGAKQSGSWEFAEYRADGTYITPPQKSASCAECHIKAGPEKDFVFKARFAEAKK